MSTTAPRATLLFCLLAMAPALPGHAASPTLGAVSPRGGQRGTEVALVLSGARLTDAEDVLFYYPGLSVTKLEVVNDGQVKAAVKIAADCRLGEHALRVRSRTGISELRTFFVGALPSRDEVEPNGDFLKPQEVPLNVTIAGVVEGEDVDYFAVAAEKGQRVSAEIEGMRLGGTLFDPYVAILNSKRFELAAADDSALAGQDSSAAIIAPESGVYVVEVRESAYGGSGGCLYRLHVGTFPRPLAAVPAGARRGEETEVTLLGDAAGELRQKVLAPQPVPGGLGIFAEDALGIAPSALPFRVVDFGNVVESEPNDDPEHATRAEAPVALNGVVAKPGDVDYFRFTARTGQALDIHVYGRRIRSPLDSVVVVWSLGGGAIASNDDLVGPDSYLRFTPPEDKEYALSVADHLGKGGPIYAYRVEIAPVEPRLSVSIPKVALFSQERQTIAVPRGNRAAVLLQAARSDFGGELVIEAEGLPPGITIAAESMPASLDVVPVVFEAADGAPLSGTLARLGARHVDPAIGIRGGFSQVVELVTGGPGQSVYWRHEVDRAAVSVAEEAPFRIRIVEPKAPLVQNGAMNLRIVAERKDGFTAPIGVQMVFNPPGVGSAGGVSIPEGQSEALIAMNANGGAETRRWKIAVNGVATAGNGPVWVSSQLATLEVAPPYVVFQMERAAVEQGKDTEIVCKIEHRTPFAGSARVELLGLPAKTTTSTLEISSDTKEAVFRVAAGAAAPPGVHKNIFCQVYITKDGEPVLHAVGGTELRIDVPLPPKPNEPPKPAPAVAAEKPPEAAAPPKRLTRLEKLRLEEVKRAKETKSQDGK